MKKLRIISLIAVFALVFTAFACTAFATEGETATGTVTSAPVSNADLIVSDTDSLSEYPLEKFEIPQHRLSVLIPKLDTSFSAANTNTEIAGAIPGYDLEGIINYNDSYYSGNILSYLYSGTSSNGDVMFNILYTSNNYTKFVGDYSDLDEAAINDLCNSTYTNSGTYPEVLSVNGNTFLYSEGIDTEYNCYSYSMETIVKGGRYTIYIDLVNPSPADKAIVSEIVDSIRIGGFRTNLYGAADSTLVTVLLIVVIVLTVIVALLTFFIIRFSLFTSAAGNKFNIIGFNMPPSKEEIAKLRREQKKSAAKKGSSKASTITESID